MQLLLPLFLSSVLVAAAPHPKRVTETVVYTKYEYVQEPSTQPTPAPVPESKPSTPATAYVPPKAEPVGTTPSVVDVQSKQVSSKSNSDSDTTRMSANDVSAIYKTCWNGQLQWPLPNTPNPCVDNVAKQLSLYPVPASSPNTLTVHNYCGYNIYFNHFNGGSLLESSTLSPGGSIDRPLSGTVFKASKSADMAKDMLIEYAVANGQLYYDLSLITCLGSTNGLPNADTSACAGHEAGLQLGNANAKSFQCAAGAWCDDQVYLYQENLCKKQNPVTSCSPSHGLTMEFCASMKK